MKSLAGDPNEILSVSRGHLRALVEAARGMTEGNFRKLVSITAKDEIGQLAYYLNQTLMRLQQLDPTVKGSSAQLPHATSQLSDVVRTTEAATLRVLDEIEKIMEEEEQAIQELEQVKGLLRQTENSGHSLEAPVRSLEAVGELQRRVLDRAMEIIAAMEFQDVTAQKIEKTLHLMEEVATRLLNLLILFKLQESSSSDFTMERDLRLMDQLADATQPLYSKQALVDQLLAEYARRKQSRGDSFP